MTKEERGDAHALAIPAEERQLDRVAMVAAAFFGANQQPVERIADVIKAVTTALANGGASTGPTVGVADAKNPAVPIKKSLGDDFIICLEDGKKLTMLKRYLRSQFNMSPEEYRAKWGLPHDYPMVAPAYARLRSEFAKKIGFGRIATSAKKARK